MDDSGNTRLDTANILAVDADVARSTGSAQFGVTREGFVPKPFPRLLAEKLATARALLGDDVDLGSGSVLRKLFEVSALEETRTWAALATMYDNLFAVSASGHALSHLGDELGLPRPWLEATGRVSFTLSGALPAGISQLMIPRGARLLTAGGHHVATNETFILSPASPKRDVAVVAFYPGPEHNLDPALAAADGTFPQKIDRWNWVDPMLSDLLSAETAAGAPLVTIEHTVPLSGGNLQWPDARYRELLLRAPRSIWTTDAVRIAVSMVPGVRQVQVRDAWGGLDLHQSIFGNFNFIERVFGSERDLGSPYYFTILVAPTRGAIWDGPEGLRVAVESAIEDLRPIGIFPQIIQAEEVGVGLAADLIVRGLPLPTGTRSVVNQSEPAIALKNRLLARVRSYVDAIQFGEPVRAAEVVWAIMNEPGIVDAREPRLLRYPPRFDAIDFQQGQASVVAQEYPCGANIDLQVNQIPVFVDDASRMQIV